MAPIGPFTTPLWRYDALNDADADKSIINKTTGQPTPENVAIDWFRNTNPSTIKLENSGYVYEFTLTEGDSAQFKDNQENSAIVQTAIDNFLETNIKKLSPQIKSFIKNHAHQGLFNVAANQVTLDLSLRRLRPMFANREQRFVVNKDGSMTFIETVDIVGYTTHEDPETIIEPIGDKPIARITREVNIKPTTGALPQLTNKTYQIEAYDFVANEVFGNRASIRDAVIFTLEQKDILSKIMKERLILSNFGRVKSFNAGVNKAHKQLITPLIEALNKLPKHASLGEVTAILDRYQTKADEFKETIPKEILADFDRMIESAYEMIELHYGLDEEDDELALAELQTLSDPMVTNTRTALLSNTIDYFNRVLVAPFLKELAALPDEATLNDFYDILDDYEDLLQRQQLPYEFSQTFKNIIAEVDTMLLDAAPGKIPAPFGLLPNIVIALETELDSLSQKMSSQTRELANDLIEELQNLRDEAYMNDIIDTLETYHVESTNIQSYELYDLTQIAVNMIKEHYEKNPPAKLTSPAPVRKKIRERIAAKVESDFVVFNHRQLKLAATTKTQEAESQQKVDTQFFILRHEIRNIVKHYLDKYPKPTKAHNRQALAEAIGNANEQVMAAIRADEITYTEGTQQLFEILVQAEHVMPNKRGHLYRSVKSALWKHFLPKDDRLALHRQENKLFNSKIEALEKQQKNGAPEKGEAASKNFYALYLEAKKVARNYMKKYPKGSLKAKILNHTRQQTAKQIENLADKFQAEVAEKENFLTARISLLKGLKEINDSLAGQGSSLGESLTEVLKLNLLPSEELQHLSKHESYFMDLRRNEFKAERGNKFERKLDLPEREAALAEEEGESEGESEGPARPIR